MAEEAHHRVGSAADPRIRVCWLLLDTRRTNPDRAGAFLNLAEVAVLDILMILVAWDQHKSMAAL
jgi:hypothetical protein